MTHMTCITLGMVAQTVIGLLAMTGVFAIISWFVGRK